jgi:flagellar basal-body rod modification protein FlgD
MTTTAATTNSTTAAYSTSQSTAALNQNYQTFLTLLTTQLKNQDPLDPQDSSQFTNQLVEFSQVEQQIDTNSTLNTMLTNQETALATSAVNYIGKTVAGTGNTFTFDGTHSVPLGYTLGSAAASTTVSISNSSGQVVYSAAGATTAGNNTFTWNGEDASGNALPAGTYNLAASAFDSSGNEVTATTVVPGTVTSVVNNGGTTYLTVGGNEIPLAQVDTVGAGSSTSSTN